jgi:zinc transporter ZupT
MLAYTKCMHETLTVFWLSLLTAATTALGAIPLLFWKRSKPTWASYGNAVAAGCMLGASILLVVHGVESNPIGVITGMVIGGLSIWLTQALVERHKAFHVKGMSSITARKAFLIVSIMTIHSAMEGLSIGVSFAEGGNFGLIVVAAMALQNIPEGLAISLVLVPRGVSILAAAFWSFFSSIPQVIFAVPAYEFVERFHPFLAPGLGFAAGAMTWMCFSDLIPDTREHLKTDRVFLIITLTGLATFLLDALMS